MWEILQETVPEEADTHHKAFFSSILGGIVTDPALMVLHIDDHMVHRYHHRKSWRPAMQPAIATLLLAIF